MTRVEIEQNVYSAILDTVEGLGYELVEVEYINQNGQNNLTIFVGNQTGITLNDCEKVHYAIDPILDDLNPTNDKPYNLNISSPGLDRPLKTEGDYRRNLNKKLEIRLKAPLENIEGWKKLRVIKAVLLSKNENIISVQQLKTDKIIEINLDLVESVLPLIEFK